MSRAIQECVSGSDHPQRARLTVRIGIVGHRSEDLAATDEGALREAIRRVLTKVNEDALTIHQEAGVLYNPESPLLRVISPLAEGTDRLVAEEALQLGFELQCPLPFLREEYIEDFADRGSVAQFDALMEKATAVLELGSRVDRESRSEAYLAVGRTVLRQCDVLIALWDGRPAKGLGGTGQIVSEAMALEIPTVWISAVPPHEVCLPGEQGAVSRDFGKLLELLRSSFLPPAVVDSHGDSSVIATAESERAQRFFRETHPRWTLGIFFALFRYFWTRTGEPLQVRIPDLREGTWKQFLGWRALLALRPEIAEQIERVYLRHYNWADTLANVYGAKYRSAFVLTFIMGAFAVFVAFLGVQSDEPAWFYVELALILMILGITYVGRRQFWHERWIDYRLLAENLRQMQFLHLLGRMPSSFKVPAHMEVGDPRRSWFNWHFRALVRQAGMIDARFDRPYLQVCRQVLGDSIQSQVEYHRDIGKTLHIVHRRAHLAVQGFFYLAFLVCLLHFTPLHTEGPSGLVLNILAVILPGFGGALGAILHHGEFDKIAVRSRAMEARLKQLQGGLDSAGASSQDLGHIAETFSDLTLAELLDWRFVFLDKNLVLPG